MSHYTLDTSSSDVVVVLAIQGVAFACIFIPLTTVALSRIPRHQLADAAGLNSLLRQIGGSLGLAVFASLIPRITKEATVALGAHLTVDRPEVAARLAGMAQGLVAHGYDAVTAQAAAGRMLGGVVMQQVSVIAFNRLFLLSGLLFLLILPLLYFLKSPDHAPVKSAEPVHVEL